MAYTLSRALLVLTLSSVFELDSKEAWRDVQAIGKFCLDDSTSYQEGLLSLCGYARRVFTSQPTRLFLHGFYM